ncbi:acetylglutamate/acetylaminoadipate kinase [Halorubrum sp. JWXQ-INN 858]|uniref:acetylglutamate/acetylaminoadipate kinase n=1 Tax=Halorubrum sp. JWXQ-INN 858 TaxID=2690782 RepID=UPI00135719BE|nr:acetylglutamate/acetylaminoadipate kinase [Halorubrum sp. JWXQ-INN 858]MWV63533.1 acetylglutamate/acetylaminoadipate kinase [Halorubrum sp. JWXQ-INN 858]
MTDGSEAAGDGSVAVADGGDEPPVVVKIGGAKAVDPAGAVGDVAHLVANGRAVVVVHGGSTVVDETIERLGMEPTYVESASGVTGRFTDADAMEAFTMAMAGTLNTELTALFRSNGVDAVGLSGVDGGLLSGPRKSAVRVIEGGKKKIKRGEHSGRIESVNADLLGSLLADGYTPVASPPMAGIESDGDVTPVNTDADRAAAAVAGALDADLVLLTDVAGVYADPEDPGTLIESASTPAGLEAVEDAAEGFMGKKVMAAREALSGGSARVVIADANVRDPIVAALGGSGTTITASALADGDGDEGTDDTDTGTDTDDTDNAGTNDTDTGTDDATGAAGGDT